MDNGTGYQPFCPSTYFSNDLTFSSFQRRLPTRIQVSCGNSTTQRALLSVTLEGISFWFYLTDRCR